MSIIDDYTAQTVTWKRQTGVNQYNEPTFEETTIRARWQPQFTRVRDSRGEEVTSSARVYTAKPVDIGDMLIDAYGREWPVITISQPTTLGGAESHREVLV